jgi:hypothetical protein
MGDCDAFVWPKGPAMQIIFRMAGNNDLFYNNFLLAWKFATDVGSSITQMIPPQDVNNVQVAQGQDHFSDFFLDSMMDDDDQDE